MHELKNPVYSEWGFAGGLEGASQARSSESFLCHGPFGSLIPPRIMVFFFFLVVLWFELWALGRCSTTLSHSLSLFLCWVFSRQGLMNYLPRS
jgi:hypothetical protein